MEQICLVIPIVDGKSDDARDFMRELEQSRKGEYDQSERRIGITKEAWFLAQGTSGDLLSRVHRDGKLRKRARAVLEFAGRLRPLVQAPAR